jgi:hypothetical protein
MLHRLGTGEERRLLSVLPNDGRFNLVVFTGKTYLTGPSRGLTRSVRW